MQHVWKSSHPRNMQRPRAALVVAACLAVLAAFGDSAPRALSSGLSATRCPRLAQPLPADALAGATKAALAQAPALYRGIDTRGVEATRAARSSAAGPRGQQVARECGNVVAERSIVVDLFFPRMLPSASLSQGTVFVDREHGRYRVWQVAH